MASFYDYDGEFLTLKILWKGWAKRDNIWWVLWDNLKVSVSKAPEWWRATKYMITYIARSFWVKPRDIELIYGEITPHKIFKIKDPKKIPKELEWLLNIK